MWTYARELVTGLSRRGVQVTLVSFGHMPEPRQLAWTEGLRNFDFRPTAFRLEWMQDSAEDIEASSEYLLNIDSRDTARYSAPQPVLLWLARCRYSQDRRGAQRCGELVGRSSWPGAARDATGSAGIAISCNRDWMAQPRCWRLRAGCCRKSRSITASASDAGVIYNGRSSAVVQSAWRQRRSGADGRDGCGIRRSRSHCWRNAIAAGLRLSREKLSIPTRRTAPRQNALFAKACSS